MNVSITCSACAVLTLLLLPGLLADNVVRPGCDKNARVCKFHLRVAPNITMSYFPKGGEGVLNPVSVLPNGTLMAKPVTCSGDIPVPKDVDPPVVIGDGRQKDVILINGQLPGPPIVVYEGQMVEVTVANDMFNEGLTIHFHGQHQAGTPYMDGVQGVSQCPINPGEEFTYTFKANPAGTHWYHGHLGTLRSMGVYGPFIVLPRNKMVERKRRGDDPLPRFDKEFVLMAQDYMDMSSPHILELIRHLSTSFSLGWDKCYRTAKQADGLDASALPFVSNIINGKGRHYTDVDTGGKVTNKAVPIERFYVKKGQKYRFRVISASMVFGLRISIDHHPLHVIATDGNDVRTRTVESVIFFGGERYDFWVDAKDPDGTGLYWIRVETLEWYRDGHEIWAGHVEAVLHYDGAPHEDPISTRVQCTEQDTIEMLNCPYKYLPNKECLACVPLTDLRSPRPLPTLTAPPERFSEYFLNFHFTGFDVTGTWTATINGIKHIPPSSPFTLNANPRMTPCEYEGCDGEVCSCTHVLEMPADHVVQMVFSTTLQNPPGEIHGNAHPIHLHGRNFQVIKIGFPKYDPETRMIAEETRDIACLNENCNGVTWANASWAYGHVPGMINEGAPVKDTIVFPGAGYAVIRFKSTNPGFWYLHCHVEYHNEGGMSLVMKIGDEKEYPRAPRGFPTCGDYPGTKQTERWEEPDEEDQWRENGNHRRDEDWRDNRDQWRDEEERRRGDRWRNDKWRTGDDSRSDGDWNEERRDPWMERRSSRREGRRNWYETSRDNDWEPITDEEVSIRHLEELEERPKVKYVQDGRVDMLQYGLAGLAALVAFMAIAFVVTAVNSKLFRPSASSPANVYLPSYKK